MKTSFYFRAYANGVLDFRTESVKAAINKLASVPEKVVFGVVEVNHELMSAQELTAAQQAEVIVDATGYTEEAAKPKSEHIGNADVAREMADLEDQLRTLKASVSKDTVYEGALPPTEG